MTYEIERKWLVEQNKIPFNLEDCEKDYISQCYITIDNNSSLRARKIESEFSGFLRTSGECFLTIKSGKGIKRTEVEFKIAEDQYLELCKICKKKLEKIRYYYDEYQIDIFNERDLIIIEIEFDTEYNANKYDPPEWFGIEVTGNVDYLNQNLAK